MQLALIASCSTRKAEWATSWWVLRLCCVSPLQQRFALSELVAMHQARKSNHWYFKIKANVGLDSKESAFHPVCSTVVAASDIQMLPDLLRSGEKKARDDRGYQNQTEAIDQAAPGAQDMTSKRVPAKSGIDEPARRRNG